MLMYASLWYSHATHVMMAQNKMAAPFNVLKVLKTNAIVSINNSRMHGTKIADSLMLLKLPFFFSDDFPQLLFHFVFTHSGDN